MTGGPRPLLPPLPVSTGLAVLELLHPRQHGQVLCTAQLPVVAPGVPRVEGVEPDHVEGLGTERGHTQRGPGWAGLSVWPLPPNSTSAGRENLLNFIIWCMYSVRERASPPGPRGAAPPLADHPCCCLYPASPSWPQDMRTFSSPQCGWYMPSSVLQGEVEGEGSEAPRERKGQRCWRGTCIEGPGGRGCPGRWSHRKPQRPGDGSQPGRCLQRLPTGEGQAAVDGHERLAHQAGARAQS